MRLVVTPDRVESVVPEGPVVSFIQPEAQVFGTSANNVMAKFCHFIFFFASRASGERWVAKHPDTFLYSLDDAFALANRLNARNFGPALDGRVIGMEMVAHIVVGAHPGRVGGIAGRGVESRSPRRSRHGGFNR